MTTLHGKPAKKLEKQLQRGDLTRLKYYMRKYKIHVNSRLDKDQTLLHLACKEGQGHIIRQVTTLPYCILGLLLFINNYLLTFEFLRF